MELCAKEAENRKISVLALLASTIMGTDCEAKSALETLLCSRVFSFLNGQHALLAELTTRSKESALWYHLCRCYVNPMTCQHKPFLANNGQVTSAWDVCMGPNLTTTIDTGVCTTLERTS
jgi:hypothetical protein